MTDWSKSFSSLNCFKSLLKSVMQGFVLGAVLICLQSHSSKAANFEVASLEK